MDNLFIVDAFTNQPFRGNPAAICLQQKDESWMQSFAAEMNLSETAFLARNGNQWNLRWFTPTCEVDLCGHATLASAHVIWQMGLQPENEMIQFQTKSGLLTATKTGPWIELNFPVEAITETKSPPAALLEGIGQNPIFVGETVSRYFVVLDSEQAVRNLNPDLSKFMEIPKRSVIVTAKSQSPEFDFVSRYFAPKAGIPEDPVTGSAHCVLTPYWETVLGKSEMKALQVSPRGGTLLVSRHQDRVKMRGEAVTVMRGRATI